MATINSNNLAVYSLAIPTTSPLAVLDTATAIGSLIDGDCPAGVAVGEYFLVHNDGAFAGVAKRAAAAAAPTNETSNLAIVALATSSSLEATNSVNETAARNGTGGSTNYIASGAMSWSTSIDGLLDVASAAGNGVDVMDAARNRYYMVVKFNIDEGSSDTFYAGQALIDSVSISGGVDDIATYSASFSGYGDLYKG
jgi:TP901-1 family phage major tail protein